MTKTTFAVLLVCPGGGPGQVDVGASFHGTQLPAEGEEIDVVRGDGTRARGLVRLVDGGEDPPITAVLIE